MKHTPTTLRAFEAEIAEIFNAGQIKAPIHLAGGNEDHLIRYFAEQYRPGDWVCTAWRSHFHALLAGIPPADIRAKILAGRSITLTFPEHNFISSAIVGGILPIAVGIALGIKRSYEGSVQSAILTEINLGGMRYDENGIARIENAIEGATRQPSPRVHCFVGDMTARTGAFHEAYEYARGHALPLNFIVEDNGKSVGTPTHEVWGTHVDPLYEEAHPHENPWPHAGSGTWIKF
jgi:pyruvate dehydrogenase E1 component alpha subunit